MCQYSENRKFTDKEIHILLAAAVADDNECRLDHHCCRRMSPTLITHRGYYKLIIFYFNLLNLSNRFDIGIGTSMRKAAHPPGGMGSSNPRRLPW
jgi:hypothetical protein